MRSVVLYGSLVCIVSVKILNVLNYVSSSDPSTMIRPSSIFVHPHWLHPGVGLDLQTIRCCWACCLGYHHTSMLSLNMPVWTHINFNLSAEPTLNLNVTGILPPDIYVTQEGLERWAIDQLHSFPQFYPPLLERITSKRATQAAFLIPIGNTVPFHM